MTKPSPSRRHLHDDAVDCPDCESDVFVYRREGAADGWQCGLCGWKSWIHGPDGVDQELVADGAGVETDRIRVSNSRGIVYGPAVDAAGYVLTVATDERRLELELDEDAMYTLWTEVKGVPWPEPDHMGEKDRLVRQVLHAANGADEESLRDALRVLGGERP